MSITQHRCGRCGVAQGNRVSGFLILSLSMDETAASEPPQDEEEEFSRSPDSVAARRHSGRTAAMM